MEFINLVYCPGLKQVFGYEEEAATNMTEIFYRGPSDQKLLTIGNYCSF